MADMNGTKYSTNNDLMCFATNNLLTMRYRDLADGVAPKSVQCQYMLLSSTRLIIKFTGSPGQSSTTSYNYTLTSNGLCLERIGSVERMGEQPIDFRFLPIPQTNTYERVEGFTF
jgi:hypothetical protein